MSKEHVWPNWLRKYYKAEKNDAYIIASYDVDDSLSNRNLSRADERQGSLSTKKVRAVFRTCNNGWMSSLEESVKPILAGFVLGKNNTITRNQFADLSLWAVVKVVVVEHSSKNIALTPASDRNRIFQERMIPDYFRVYVGMHTLEDEAMLHRHSVTITYTDEISPKLEEGIDKNLSIVSFLVGPLIFTVVSARVDGFNIERLLPQPDEMQKIWPESKNVINFLNHAKIDRYKLLYIHHQLQVMLKTHVSGVIDIDS